MSLNLGTLNTILGADLDPLRRGEREASAIQGRIQARMDKTTIAAKGMFSGILGGLAGGAGVAQIIRTADGFETLERRIQSITRATGDYNQVFGALFEISQRNGVAFASTVETFQRLAMSAKEIGASNAQIEKVVRAVSQLGAMSGASESSMSAGLMQFGQAMGAGVVRAEEFNSILENMPLVANKIAEGLGKSVGELRKMVLEGKVASRSVFEVLLRQSDAIDSEFASFGRSFGQSMSALGNSLGKIAADVDRNVGAIDGLNDAIGLLTSNTKVVSDTISIGFTAAEIAITTSMAKGEIAARTFAHAIIVVGDEVVGFVAQIGAITAPLERLNSALASRVPDGLAKVLNAQTAALKGMVKPLDDFKRTTAGLREESSKNLEAAIEGWSGTQQADISKWNKLIAGFGGETEKAVTASDKLSAGTAKAADATKAHKSAVDGLLESMRSQRAELAWIAAGREKELPILKAQLDLERLIADARAQGDKGAAAKIESQRSAVERLAREIAALNAEIEAQKEADSLMKESSEELRRELEERQEAAKKAADAYREYSASLEDQREILQAQVEGHKELAARLEREAEIRQRLGRDVTPEQTRALEAQLKTIDELREKEKKRQEEARKIVEAYDAMAGSFSNMMERMMVDGESWRGALAGLLKDINRLIAQMLILEPLKEGLRGAMGGVNWGAMASGAVSWLGSGGAASGGAVATAAMEAGSPMAALAGPKLDRAPAGAGEGGPKIIIINTIGEDEIPAIMAGARGGQVVINHVLADIQRGGPTRRALKEIK